MTTKTNNGLFTSLIFISLLLTLCTVVLSAYIRLAQSGLGCEPWPACYGQIGVEAEQQGIAVLTQAGAEMSHKGARMVHRFIASALGITITLITLIAIRRRLKGIPGLSVALLLLATTLFLAVLGYSTPARTVPWITLGNLGGGMLMLALLWWLGQRSLDSDSFSLPLKAIHKFWAILALVLLTIQILAGAWVSASFAAAACDSSLICPDFWSSGMPLSDSFSLSRELSINATGSILLPEQQAQTISMVHRLLALVSLLYLTGFGVKLLKINPALRVTGRMLLIFLILEMLLGITSVYFHLPLFLVTLHNTLAALLLLCLVNALHHLTPKSGSRIG